MKTQIPYQILLLICAFLGFNAEAFAQWSIVKSYLQPDVKVLSEGRQVLVLENRALGDTLILSNSWDIQADLTGEIVYRRGSNPYRVWKGTLGAVQRWGSSPAWNDFFRSEFSSKIEMPETYRRAPERLARDRNTGTGNGPIGFAGSDTFLAAMQPAQTRPRQSPAAQATRSGSKSGLSRPSLPPLRIKVEPPDERELEAIQARLQAQELGQEANDFVAYLDTLYAKGRAAVEAKQLYRGKIYFEMIRDLEPQYRNVSNVLRRLNQQLEYDSENRTVSTNAGNKKLMLIWTVAGSAVLLPLMTLWFFSPVTRAKVYIARGQYLRATLLYESLIARDPSNLLHYAKLANLYLAMERCDERALAAYRRVKELNLFVRELDKMEQFLGRTKMLSEPHSS